MFKTHQSCQILYTDKLVTMVCHYNDTLTQFNSFNLELEFLREFHQEWIQELLIQFDLDLKV